LKRNGVVFACVALRGRVFSEARFAWQRRDQGRPAEPFTDDRLAPLERPWPGGTTQDLLQRMLLSVDMGGNAYVTRNRRGWLRVLRPDWVTIVRGSNAARPDDDPDGIDATLIGYLYQPGGAGSGREPVPLKADEVAHFAPDPDPLAMFRGMSWATPVVREIAGDSAMTSHKNKFLENAATPNLVVRLDSSVNPEQFEEFVRKSEAAHAGVWNAYKTMYLGGGADVTVAGSDFKQLDFKTVQGHGETRIAAASGVHPVVVGISEGMQGSSLNAGNYSQARRNVADTLFHPLWRNAAGSLQTIVADGPDFNSLELVADVRDVPFLRTDEKDAAEVQQKRAGTLNSLIAGGFTPESAVEAVTTGDFQRLEHSGLVSVQLQAPGADNGTTDGDEPDNEGEQDDE
jgi:phage portal protein BeeE